MFFRSELIISVFQNVNDFSQNIFQYLFWTIICITILWIIYIDAIFFFLTFVFSLKLIHFYNCLLLFQNQNREKSVKLSSLDTFRFNFTLLWTKVHFIKDLVTRWKNYPGFMWSFARASSDRLVRNNVQIHSKVSRSIDDDKVRKHKNCGEFFSELTSD